MEASYDAIVVGSGFGGGIAACRLAEAGKRVCVLERGRRFGRDDFPERPDQAGELIWHPAANPGGMFDVRLMRDLVVITAAGVGGGSLVYANVQLRAPADVFDDPHWPAAVDATTLEPWYTRTEEALDPVTTPADPPLRKVAAFAAAGAHAGRAATPLPIAVHFGEARTHPFSGVPQEGCQNLARCDIGCPVHAKNTVDITYIARAEARGAIVLPLHEAKRIEAPVGAGGEWRVGFERLDGGGKGTVRAPLVVLAAGTIGSPRLLLTNRARLRGLSGAIGSRFSGNGDALGVAFDPQAPDVRDARNDVGPVMTSALDLTAERRLILADGGLPPGFGGVLDIARGVNVIRGWRRWLVRARAALTLAGWTDQALRPLELGRAGVAGSNSDALIFLMFGRDAADGQMRLTPLLRRFDVRWSKAGSAQLFADLQRTAEELAAAARATPFYALEGGPLGKFMTVHPLGGCPMGDDPATSVVDDAGRVRGHPGLVVLDGSIVPTALGVNPSKTIAALAERGIAEVLAR
ncbi:MAG: cholesterol oxidase [Solirubrobacteraceae bacterium]|nr:cholesterol oxidase [Solirubrobacteraceae bacterium]